MTQAAAQLQAVLQKNPKKARHTCTKAYREQQKAQEGGTAKACPRQPQATSGPQVSEALANVECWEISASDDEGASPTGSNSEGRIQQIRVIIREGLSNLGRAPQQLCPRKNLSIVVHAIHFVS